VKKVCSLYADERTGWRGYYADYWRWKRADPTFASVVSAYIDKKGKVGRPRLDGGDKSWQEDYCLELSRTNGNYLKASAKTPYSVRQIAEFCDQYSTTYDEKFAKMVEEVFLTKAGEVQEKFLGLLDDSNFMDQTSSKITHDKAWVFLRALEKLDSGRWGRKSELNVKGRIDHRHTQDRIAGSSEIIDRLWSDQMKFFEARRAEMVALPPHPETIDAEPLPEDKPSEA